MRINTKIYYGREFKRVKLMIGIFSLGITFYFVINIAINMKYRNHVIFQKRAPYILLFHQFSSLIVLNMIAFQQPCIITAIFAKFMILSNFLRYVYTSNIIVKINTLSKRIYKIFWRDEENSNSKWFQTICCAIFATTVYDIFEIFKADSFVDKCLSNGYLFGPIVSLLLLMPSIIDMVLYATKDDGTIELVASNLSIMAILICLEFMPLLRDFLIVLVLVNLLFWCTTFPLFLVFYTNYRARTRITINTNMFDSGLLLSTSERLFCKENILFLIDYQLYKLNPDNFEYLKVRYILVDSPYELNLTEEQKNMVLESQTNLEIVNHEIIDMVQANVVSQIS